MNRGGGLGRWAVSLMLAAAWTVWGQDIDTVIFEHVSKRTFTIIDQVEDPAERHLIQALSGEKNPKKRRRLAEEFLGNHPQSRFLAYVYEAASKASADLGDLGAALEYGAESLKLLPENPLLLVSLANVQVHRGLLEEADASAARALEYFDRFRHPARYSEEEWAKLEPQLRASCYYVLGRAAVERAVGAGGSKKLDLVKQAQEWLLRSRDLYDRDSSAAYLLGLTCLGLGDKRQAAVHFADAYHLGGTVAEPALQHLRALYAESGNREPAGFETYLASTGHSGNAERKTDTQQAGHPAAPAEYAGSDSCKRCHMKIYQSWRKTGMGRMFRPYEPDNVFGDFTNNNVFRGKDGLPLARAAFERGRHFFEFPVEGGLWRRYPVDYTIGSKWQQAYATRLENGRIHVFPIQYNRLRQEWLNFWEMIDPPGSQRADVRAFPQLTDATSYQRNCSPCHTSQLLAKGRDTRPENLVFREAGVNCEMCHGPSAGHVARMKAGEIKEVEAIDPPVRFARTGHKDYVAICSQCHMQSGFLQLGPNGEANYSGESRFFTNRSRGVPYAELSVKAFYKDGRFRETTFIVESFIRSACFQKGGAHCGNCHNPHPEDPLANPKSLKFPDQPDRMCLQCHESMSSDLEAHTHHPVSSEGSRCVSCHMPKIMNSLMFQAGTHRIDDIPQPDMTLRFGPAESPNACLPCHQERDAAWVARELSHWKGQSRGGKLN